MFRALAQHKKENFQGSYDSYVQGQTNTYTQQYANSVPVTFPKDQIGTLLGNSLQSLLTSDPNTRQGSPASSRDLNLQNYAMSVQVSEELKNKSAACSIASIDSLIGSLNPSDTLRCGWVYTKGNPGDQPIVSQGALGTKNGPSPFTKPPRGTWYWDLDAAKKQILTDRCGALTSCTNVGAPNYANCAWSVSASKGVPVDNRGNLLYPGNYLLNGTNLVTTSAGCPPPPPPGSPAYEVMKSKDVCMPDESGKLSRDCMLQQITAAGCSRDGDLYQQLVTNAVPNNYAKGLTNKTAFKTYQQQAITPLMTSVITDGSVTTQVALANFQTLATSAAKVSNTSLNFAARDLCLKQGTMDQYDFCSEISDNTPPPFALNCLQTLFRQMGGQPAGKNYPTEQTLSQWNALANWRAAKDTIITLQGGMKSTDAPTQASSLANFLGIQRQIPQKTGQIGLISGLELFWYNDATNTFLGRQVKNSSPSSPNLNYNGYIGQTVDQTGLSTQVSYTLLTNLRVTEDTNIRLRTKTDDGTVMVLNKDLNPAATRKGFGGSGGYNGIQDDENMFSRNWDQPPTTHTASVCWKLTANGPNYMFSYWQQTRGLSVSFTEYSPCDKNQWAEIPSSWFSLTQEPKSPMIAWEGSLLKNGITDFIEYRLPSLFPFKKSSSSLVVESNLFSGLSYALNIKNGAYATSLPRQLSENSWRSLTIATTINTVPAIGSYHLLSFGYLSIDILPKTATTVTAVFNWTSASLNTTNSPMVIDNLPIDPKIPYLFYAGMSATSSGAIPTQITVSCAKLSDWAKGNASTTQSRTTTGGNGLYNTTDSAGLTIGNMVPSANVSADFTVGWIHLFDYPMTMDDISRDASNAWIRAMKKIN